MKKWWHGVNRKRFKLLNKHQISVLLKDYPTVKKLPVFVWWLMTDTHGSSKRFFESLIIDIDKRFSLCTRRWFKLHVNRQIGSPPKSYPPMKILPVNSEFSTFFQIFTIVSNTHPFQSRIVSKTFKIILNSLKWFPVLFDRFFKKSVLDDLDTNGPSSQFFEIFKIDIKKRFSPCTRKRFKLAYEHRIRALSKDYLPVKMWPKK